MSNIEYLKSSKPELVVDLTLYPTEQGGRKSSVRLGWGSPCTIQHERGDEWVCWDGWPLLGDTVLAPGESCRVGYIFSNGQKAIEALSVNGKFYLWEGRLIGEAIIVQSENSN
jgi:hypothetical protein